MKSKRFEGTLDRARTSNGAELSEQLKQAFDEALAHPGPALVEIITDVDLI